MTVNSFCFVVAVCLGTISLDVALGQSDVVAQVEKCFSDAESIINEFLSDPTSISPTEICDTIDTFSNCLANATLSLKTSNPTINAFLSIGQGLLYEINNIASCFPLDHLLWNVFLPRDDAVGMTFADRQQDNFLNCTFLSLQDTSETIDLSILSGLQTHHKVFPENHSLVRGRMVVMSYIGFLLV
eukprot:m.106324 g.106324  ORF g.106324 m.106324 type:complete len:186 (-) comp9151_c0_seq3:2647-3204(-)